MQEAAWFPNSLVEACNIPVPSTELPVCMFNVIQTLLEFISPDASNAYARSKFAARAVEKKRFRRIAKLDVLIPQLEAERALLLRGEPLVWGDTRRALKNYKARN